jgi:hypothetical protein
VKTLTVDDHRRVRLPGVKPRARLAYEKRSDGTITLREAGAKAQELFPRGSLKKYLTPERDLEQLAILKACVPDPE